MHHSTEKGAQMSNQNHTTGYQLHHFGVVGPACSRTFQGIGALIVVLGSLVLAVAPAQAAIAHKYISSLTGEPGGSFGANVCGVTADPATGNVYVADRENNAIDIFEPSGAGAYTYKSQISGASIPFGSFGNAFLQAPCSVAVSDVTGDVYFAGSSENSGNTEDIFVFDDLGDWIKTINGSGTAKEGGTPQGSFGAGETVANVAIDQSSGEFYVSSSHYELVDRFNSANEYQSQFSAPNPNWLSGSSGGDVYDYSKGDVYEFDSSGSQIAEIAVAEHEENSIAVGAEGDVYVAGEELYETSQEQNRHLTPVDQYNPGGKLEGETRGTPSGPFSKPESVAVNSSGGLLVADRSSSGVIGSPGAVDVFGAGVLVPATSVQAPSGVNPTTVVLNGSVNPAGSEVTSCEFEYDTSISYGQSVPCEQTVGSGTSPVAVTAKPIGLSPDTTYHYRLNAANADGGNAYEAGTNDEVFTTPGVPRVDSESAEVKSTEKTGQTHATLKAQITPDSLAGHETTYQFEYGETESYGTSIPISPGDLGSGEAPVSVEAALSGLKVGTTYHYRVVAENEFSKEAGKAVAGLDQTFTTVAAVLVEGTSVSKVTATSVTFNAQIDPLGTDTSAYFQYGTVSCAASPASCTDVPLPPGRDIGSAEGYQALSEPLQDLAPSTTYYFRVIASNVLGTVEGEHNAQGEEVVHTFTTQALGSSRVLPDDRQWELVSSPNKFGALIYPISEGSGVIQAAADGDAITYGTSDVTELQPRGSTYHLVQVLSRRGAGASSWSSQDIETPNNYETGVLVNIGYEYRFFSSDLSLAVLRPEGAFTPLERDGVSEEVSPRATERTVYLRSDFTCQATPATCYTPLVTDANTPPETKIGGNEESKESLFDSAVNFVGATPDLSHVVLTSYVPLIEEAPSEALYEWAGGRLQPVSVLPLNEGGAWVADADLGGLTNGAEEARNAISTDGSRVVWSDGSDKGLYMSDMAGGKTESVRIGGAGAEFVDASSDDSKVFFVQGGKPGSGEPVGVEDLYVFEVTSGEGEPLVGSVTRLTEGAEVQSTVLGVSEDGSYVYFVANGILGDGAAHGANTGNCGSSHLEPFNESCNLYVDHYNGESKEWEAPSFIAAPSGADGSDWRGELLRLHTSRVSPNGRYLAFMSDRSLTGYDNIDLNEDPTAGEEREGVSAGTRVKHYDQEVYLYDAVEHKLVCASCNPTGARPVGVKLEEEAFVDDELWGRVSSRTWLAANVPGFTPYSDQKALYQSRYLSDSGRLFFNSHEALVPQDVNGQWDVYEYEPPGIGDCTAVDVTFSPRSGGCVGLISSGESAQESAFLDASENGDDVFFLTTSQLSSQDFDDDYDVYDAHVCGAEGVACAPVVTPPPTCTTEASCKPAPTPQPTLYAPPASATFNGPGNLAPPPPAVVKKTTTKKTVKCKKGFVKNKKDKCVRSKSKKKAKKSSANRRAKS
jgi:hypothetical protein